MLRIILALFSLSFTNCFGSSEESKYKYSDEKVLSQVARESQVIIRGKVIAYRIAYYIDEKEASLEEAKGIDSDEGKNVYAETTATIKIEAVLKGPIGGEEVTLQWRDSIRTDCPHIPMREYFTDGIWFTLNRSAKTDELHRVDWMPAKLQDKLRAAIRKQGEQNAAEQPASRSAVTNK